VTKEHRHIGTVATEASLAKKSDPVSTRKMQDTDFRRTSFVRLGGVWLWFVSDSRVSQKELRSSCSVLAAMGIQTGGVAGR